MVICLKRGADSLRMVQLIPTASQNPIVSCLRLVSYLSGTGLPRLSSKNRLLHGCGSNSSSSFRFVFQHFSPVFVR